ncbi:MAG: hypothetical protein C7B45_14400 [Sulfobacillus acidophilus]|uniref:Transposase putative helix-turn-helix domain-containing protein n=1 Tax=Sulfobacillus acidophilus TaxID=53633 RepID=A0A2T2WEC7_9FIRM|nr:MAG: hypothetical protein C7B45_14400 [Sulfobacillus acidophilus]
MLNGYQFRLYPSPAQEQIEVIPTLSPDDLFQAYRYRLYPTAEQAAFLNRQLGSVRYVYNWALAVATTTYQTQGRGITRFQLDKRLTALKQELPWLSEVAAQPLQQALVHLDKAFTRFFREKKGYPRFRCKRGQQRGRIPKESRSIGKTASSTFPKRDGFERCLVGAFKDR